MDFYARFLARIRVRSTQPRLKRRQFRCLPPVEPLKSWATVDVTAFADAEPIAVFRVVDPNGDFTSGRVPVSAVTVNSIMSWLRSARYAWRARN